MTENDNSVIRLTTTARNLAALVAAAESWGGSERPGLTEGIAEAKEALGQPERAKRHNKTLLDMGIPNPQEPVRGESSWKGHDDYEETHPAYALIGVNRRTGGNRTLTGSDFQHNTCVVLTIKRATMYRALASDRFHADRQIVEVTMSEAQWATLVSAFGIGDGVPCTLEWTETDGHVPAIVPITDRRAQVNDEVAQTLADAVAKLDAILADEKVTNKVKDGVRLARQELVSNIPFVIRSADKHVETTIEKAKVEVHAYLTGAIQRAGITALGGEPPVQLVSGEREAD